MYKKMISLLLCVVFIISTVGCNGVREKSAGISIVTTLFPQYDFAKAIVGDKGDVSLLLTPGTDSHSFELTASDISKINNCDVFVYTGPGMEIWVDNIIESLDENVRILNLSKNVELICSEHTHDDGHHGHDHDAADPHIWTSPAVAMKMLEDIYNSICNADSSNVDYYTDNYKKYLSDLEKLDEEFREIASLAEGKKLYFSGKFAFAYFTSEYDFNYVAPFNSCSDLQVEDLASLANLINEMKDNDIDYIFYEEFATQEIVNKITSETGAVAYQLHSAHNVSKSDFDKGVTYYSIMKTNADNLRKALIDGKAS